jgi:hypothetical protein
MATKLVESVEVIGRVPDFAEAMRSPFDYELGRTLLGWTLAHVGDGVALSICGHCAMKLIARYEEEEQRELQAEAEAERLDEEYGDDGDDEDRDE